MGDIMAFVHGDNVLATDDLRPEDAGVAMRNSGAAGAPLQLANAEPRWIIPGHGGPVRRTG
jgi:hypothetical protein